MNFESSESVDIHQSLLQSLFPIDLIAIIRFTKRHVTDIDTDHMQSACPHLRISYAQKRNETI